MCQVDEIIYKLLEIYFFRFIKFYHLNMRSQLDKELKN